MTVRVEKMPVPKREGDWHDAPLRWSVKGPGEEVQNFSLKKWALKFASFRRNSTSYAPTAKDRAAGWPARVRDVGGLRVRTLRQMANAQVTIPYGATGTLRNASSWERLEFKGDPCPGCGVSANITGLSRRDLQVLGKDDE